MESILQADLMCIPFLSWHSEESYAFNGENWKLHKKIASNALQTFSKVVPVPSAKVTIIHWGWTEEAMFAIVDTEYHRYQLQGVLVDGKIDYIDCIELSK